VAQTVGQHQQGAITTPANNANIVSSVLRGNFTALRTSHNDHDSDPAIHFQSSVAGSRPAAGTAGRKWIDSDTLKVYFDTGSVWSEIAYGPTADPTFTGTVTVADLTASGTITGTLATASQPNITEVGTLTTATITTANVTTLNNQSVRVPVGGSEWRLTGTAANGAKVAMVWTDVQARMQVGPGAAAIVLGQDSALSTISSIGFVHLVSMSGQPTGTVTATGGVPMVFDTLNNRLWAYHASDWHYVAFTATP